MMYQYLIKYLIFICLIIGRCVGFNCICALLVGFQVNAQTIQSIRYEGLEKTRSSFVDKIILTQEGQTLDSLRIARDVQNLIRLPSFANVRYQVLTDSLGDSHLLLQFEENKTIIPYLALWTSVRQVAFRAGISEFNLLGQNMSLSVFYQFNGFHSWGIHYEAPFLFSKKWGIDVNSYQFTSEEPLFFKNKSANYRYSNLGIEANILYQPHFNHRFKLGLNPFLERYLYLSGAISENVPQFAEKQKLLLKLTYEYNNLHYHYYLLKGIKIKAYYQQILIPDKFQIFWTDVHLYQRNKEKGNFASRLRFGLSTNSDSPFAPFSLDNNLNIRGIGNIIDRGTGVVVINAEYRHTFYEKKWFALQGNFFIDAGSWRNLGGKLSDLSQFENTEIYSGIGLRLIHKFFYGMALRVDYGFDLKDPLHRQGLTFGIGQYF